MFTIYFPKPKWILATICVAIYCISFADHGFAKNENSNLVHTIPGISGMAAMPGNSSKNQKFVVVIDKKDRDRPKNIGSRVGILTILDDKSQSYQNVRIPTNEWGEKQASDLESICHVPGTLNTFLLMESGYRDGEYGRIFMVEITQKDLNYHGKVKKTYQLPATEHQYNLEGMVCFEWQDQLHLFLGDRGKYSATNSDSKASSHGTLFYAQLPDETSEITWNNISKLIAPSFADLHGKAYRHCSSLHIRAFPENQNRYALWVSADYDPDNKTGPYYSEIYIAGILNLSSTTLNNLFIAIPNPHPVWRVDGLKIEALENSKFKNSALCMGTDDEALGGIWRNLVLKPFHPSGHAITRQLFRKR